MTEAAEHKEQSPPSLGIAPGPHIADVGRTTRGVMIDVLIALAPVVAMAVYVFRWRAGMQIGICVASCVFFEWLFQRLRGRPQTIGDFSAAVTGLILALSIPWTAPWYVGFIGSGVAVIFGKLLFGGLGSNIFNPAMVGRAFLQACFTARMTTYTLNGHLPPGAADAVTKATPMAAGKFEQIAFPLKDLAIGTVNGSVGETSAIACVIGGLYLILRRSAAWQIPAGMLLAAAVVAGVNQAFHPDAALTATHHMLGGAMLFGAFFIATDPVSSPLSKRGRWIFGAGVGVLVMLIRLYANVPEGVMYAVLVMNMTVPLIDRWSVPRPVGGPVPEPKPAA